MVGESAASQPPEREGVTRLVEDAGAGSKVAAAELLPLVYDQLRAIAREQMRGERHGHTLQATALVNEAYLRLLGGPAEYAGRGAFFHAAAEAMRRILIEHARARGAAKRGGGRGRFGAELLESIGGVADLARAERGEEIVAFDEALLRLEGHDARFAAVVRLRFYAGLSVEQTARALGISERTVNNDWTYGRAWLARELRNAGRGGV